MAICARGPVHGRKGDPEWGRIYTHLNEEFNLEAVTDEVVGVVRKGLEEHPNINTMISYVAMALNEYKMF